VRAWAGIAVAMAAAVATLAPTTTGGDDDGRARLPAHARAEHEQNAGHEHNAEHAEHAEYARALPPPQQQPQDADRNPGQPATEPRATVTIRYSEPVVPVLPLGAGLACLGVGIAIIGLRIRTG
jgi:hypothetical protein